MRTERLLSYICCIGAFILYGCADGGIDDGADETPSSGTQEQLAPPVLVPGDVTTTSISVGWSAVDNASGYACRVNEGEETVTDSVSWTVTGLESGTRYRISVRALGDGIGYGDSPWSDIELSTEEAGMFAFSFRRTGDSFYCKVVPQDSELPYYYYFMSRERWDSFQEPQDVVEWKIEELKDIAADLGTTFPEILLEENIRYWGESEAVFDVSYDTEYVAYAFAVYDDGSTGAIEWTDFSKIFPDMSVDGSVGIEFTDTQPDLLHTVCTPDAGTGCYYQVMLETSQAMEELEKVGEETFIKELLEVQQSGMLQGITEEDWINLQPGTSYTLCVVGFDLYENVFLETAEAVTGVELVNSRLFEELVGEWQGVQTFMDGNGVMARSEFTMTIATSEGSYDYRMWNQLVCKLDGYTCLPEYGTEGIPYYSPMRLIEEGFSEEEAYHKFGPKLIMTINEQEQIRIQADGTDILYGWSELGDVFMMGANDEYRRLDTPLTVLHPSANMMTIRCDYQGYYPSLFTRTDTGWMIHYLGVSDITLFKVD